ncbi:MAG: dephospho-CoA kinase [Saezia sp.]
MTESTALRIGLTGGIGSGKSTVAGIFKRLGFPVIDFDQIAKDLTKGQDGIALKQIHTAFGNAVFQADHTLSRAQLRELIFRSEIDKKLLETILHPLIRSEAERQYQLHSRISPLVIFDMPLLAESPEWQKKLDKILVIDCNEEIQTQRVITRSGWGKEQIKAIIASQASRLERLAIATDVIVNNDISIEALEKQVGFLLNLWQET